MIASEWFPNNEVMRHISDNIEGAEKICFPNKKHIYCGCALGKLLGNYSEAITLKLMDSPES